MAAAAANNQSDDTSFDMINQEILDLAGAIPEPTRERLASICRNLLKEF